MIKNEKQYKSAKVKLEKWLRTQEQLRIGASIQQPDWLVAEQSFGIEQEVVQLAAEIKQYEDLSSGKVTLPDLGLVLEIPYLLISWRIARHLTQRDLATRVGLHENQIQKYESEDYGAASLQTLKKIASVLLNERPPSADMEHSM